MLTNISKLEVKVDGKSFSLLCDFDSPLTSVKEALFQFTKFIAKIQDDVAQKQKDDAEKVKDKVETEQDEYVEVKNETAVV